MPHVEQKPREEEFDPQLLERLIEAGEQARETLAVLSKKDREAYSKQFNMLLEKIEKQKVLKPKDFQQQLSNLKALL